MLKTFRHDAITLHSKASEDEFEKFMIEELIPYFIKRYKGPTRTSVADIKSQTLVKDSKGRGKYLWITAWDGAPDAVRGAMFENARMIKFEDTETMLKKLATFGKRGAEKVFRELAAVDIATNT